MPTSQQRSSYEQGLARAHRALFWTRERAEAIGDEGAAEDITALLDYLSVMLQDSLKGRKRARRQEQLSLDYCA